MKQLFQIAGDRFSPVPYAAFYAIVLTISVLAFSLQPNEAGFGTHTQLGLPPCGFLELTGIACPSCGLTTSVAWLAKGNVMASLKTQPFGLILFLTAAAMAVWIPVAVKRRTPFSEIMRHPHFESLQTSLLFLFLLSWIYKIVIML